MKTEETKKEETKKIVSIIVKMMMESYDPKNTSNYDPSSQFEFDWGDYSPKN